MTSIGSQFGQRKQKKMLVIKAIRFWNTTQVLAALQQTTLSAPVVFLGVDSAPVGSVVTDKQLGQSAIVAKDSDLAIIFSSSGAGLAAAVATTSSLGESLRPLGKKFTIGTKVYSDLVTLQKVQRTDFGTTTTQGVTTTGTSGNNSDAGALPASDGDGFGTFWVVTESFSASGGNSALLNTSAATVAQACVISI